MTSKKSFSKVIAIIMAVVTLFTTSMSFSMTAQAATVNTKYPTKNITGYILSTNNKTAIAYSSNNCSSSSRIGYIYSTDDAAILAIYTDGTIKVKVPWTGYSNGRVVYSKLSYFFQNTSSVYTKKATVKTPCYSRSNLSKSLGYVYVGDTCYVVGESGSYYQVLCPWTGSVYRICWVNKSAFNSHSHTYSISGYEAAHPHKIYKKCSCGAYYYTGQTTKYANCLTCYPNNTSFNPVWPVKNCRYISTMYRYWNGGNPLEHGTRSKNIYNAFDLSCSLGDTVFAVEKGTVVFAGSDNSGFGTYVVIKHSNGLYSLYGHLSQVNVSNGSSVTRGQTIGKSGSTGKSTGPHLHFEMYDPNNCSKKIDPFNTYYKGKISVTVGGNSYKANIKYTNDSYAQAWCKWLNNNCKKNASGDYVF